MENLCDNESIIYNFMKHNRLFIVLAFVSLLFVSCNKNQFDFSNFHGVEAQGEWLLPVAHGQYTVTDLMRRFEVDSLIDYTPTGNMSYNFFLEQLGVIDGNDLLEFRDLFVDEYYSINNMMPGYYLPNPIDTMFLLSQSVNFHSDNISVLSARMKSGSFDFQVLSNAVDIQRIEISSIQIKDADGNPYVFMYEPDSGLTNFDIAGLYYETVNPNALAFKFKVYARIQDLTMPEFDFHLHIAGFDFALSEMNGYVSTYDIRNTIDTTFSIFPDNMSGTLAVENVHVTLNERNTFGLDTRLVVDTAILIGADNEPIPLISPLPLVIDANATPDYIEVFQQPLDGTLDTHAGNFFLSSNLIVNPENQNNLVTITDASAIDMQVNVNVPFEFNMDNVHYVDTVNMRLSEISSPEWIKKLTLELTFNSTVPFNMIGKFQMLDSEHNEITDVLIDEATLITASLDGQVTTVTVPIEITDQRLQTIMQSDRIILDFDLDSEGRSIVLNANQGLQFYVKAKVEYDGTFDFEN